MTLNITCKTVSLDLTSQFSQGRPLTFTHVTLDLKDYLVCYKILFLIAEFVALMCVSTGRKLPDHVEELPNKSK